MDANKNCGGGRGDMGPPSLCHLKFFHFLEFFIPGFEKMDTKEQGYWKDFSEAIHLRKSSTFCGPSSP